MHAAFGRFSEPVSIGEAAVLESERDLLMTSH